MRWAKSGFWQKWIDEVSFIKVSVFGTFVLSLIKSQCRDCGCAKLVCYTPKALRVCNLMKDIWSGYLKRKLCREYFNVKL